MEKNRLPAIEKIVGDASASMHRRLKAQSLKVTYVILAVTPDGTGIIRSNAAPGALTDLAEMLKAIAEQTEAPPTDDDTRH